MAGMYKRSMMTYSSPWAKFKGAKHNGTPIFGDIIGSVFKSIYDEKLIFGGCKI